MPQTACPIPPAHRFPAPLRRNAANRSMSECPSHCLTVRRSTHAHSDQVANVARNLCNQKFCGSSPARSAAAFRSSRKFILGLHPAVGKTIASDFKASQLFNNLGGLEKPTSPTCRFARLIDTHSRQSPSICTPEENSRSRGARKDCA